MRAMYWFLDIFFFVFHSSIIILVLFGWMWRKTRKLSLIAIVCTAFSWFVLGIWYGYGYCPCTDWHWQVRMKLGHFDMRSSYIGFLIESVTGLEVSRRIVDVLALVLLVAAAAASVWANSKDRRKHVK